MSISEDDHASEISPAAQISHPRGVRSPFAKRGLPSVTQKVRPGRLDRLLFVTLNALCYAAHPRLVWSFRRRRGVWPNIANPGTYHDKYIWRKVFDRAPWQTLCSDKLRAKDYVRERLCGVRIPRTLWVGERLSDCPEKLLAGDVAIKANHGCRFNRFIKGGRFDRKELARVTERWLATDYSRRHGQWAYRGIQRRLFAEELLAEEGRLVGREYKVYVAAGRAIYTYACYDRDQPTQQSDIFDRTGVLLPGAVDIGTPRRMETAPGCYPAIVSAAETIGRDFDFVRCDFYLFRAEIWFSEMTVYSAGGYAWLEDPATMAAVNSAWDIRNSWLLTTPQSGWQALYARALRRSYSPVTGCEPLV